LVDWQLVQSVGQGTEGGEKMSGRTIVHSVYSESGLGVAPWPPKC